MNWFPSLSESTTGFRFALGEATLPGLIIGALLLLLSCFSWTVMVSKLWTVQRARRRNRDFIAAFRESASPLSLFRADHPFRGAPLASVYRAGCRALGLQLIGSGEPTDNFANRLATAQKLAPSQTSPIHTAMERSVGECGLKLESQMTLLATAVSAAPFLGLLGTVWGVMDTFSAVVASESAATLKNMAPGVSAALLTTVVALLVAIPAIFGYNYLASKIKQMIVELDNFAAELAERFDHTYVEHHPPITSSVSMSTMGAPANPTPDTRHDPRPNTPHMPAPTRQTTTSIPPSQPHH